MGREATMESPLLNAPFAAPSEDRDSPLDELRRRWVLARAAALGSVLETAQGMGEAARVAESMAADRAGLLKAVFDNSLALGRGFRRFHGVDLTLSDLARSLPSLGAPCHDAAWATSDGAPERRSQRLPCGASAAECAYWREASHGLVSGLTSAVYYTRVASPAGGADHCSDLLHLEALTTSRYEDVPDTLREPLRAACGKLDRVSPGARVEVLGLQEGELHVRVHALTPSCGLDLFTVLQRTLARALPGLTVRDASAKSILPS